MNNKINSSNQNFRGISVDKNSNSIPTKFSTSRITFRNLVNRVSGIRGKTLSITSSTILRDGKRICFLWGYEIYLFYSLKKYLLKY